MIIQLAAEHLLEPSGQLWPPPDLTHMSIECSTAKSTQDDEGAPWVRRAAQLAAAAASGSDSKARKRLIVVNPLDVERKVPNPGLQRALEACAASSEGNAGSAGPAFSELAQRQLVAVRDVHTDEATVARLRDAFSKTFCCPVTTNLYMNGTVRAFSRDG